LMQGILNYNNWLSAAGGATFLEGLGFSDADASTIVSTIGNLATLADIYQGTTGQNGTFNYMANTETLWGGM
jgi:hypothetical protein